MAEPTNNNPVSGLRILYIIMIVLSAIGTISSAAFLGTLARLAALDVPNITLFAAAASIIHFTYLALYTVAMAGLAKRAAFSVPWGRAALAVTLLWIPVGTIFGALMLSRLNSPEVKKYLNYPG